MTWEIEYTDEFEAWWQQLESTKLESVAVSIQLLEARGPALPFPYSSAVLASRYSHMRELRIQHKGIPIRVIYAFDPRRVAILLIGGDKKGGNRWYKKFVPLADRLYAKHLAVLKRKGS
jgi:hypothetical protein